MSQLPAALVKKDKLVLKTRFAYPVFLDAATVKEKFGIFCSFTDNSEYFFGYLKN
jgi:hypothetical protein